MPESKFVSGFVSLVGRPNAGKSTLLNALVGAKVAIVTDKPQTTRTTIQGALNLPGAQIVFVDTPGIHSSSSSLNRRMMEAVRSALADRELLLYMVDAAHPSPDEDARALDMVKKSGTPTALVLNKVDRVKEKNRLLPVIERYKELADFIEIVPVSALTGDGLERLREVIVQRLPEGPPLFPEDYLTDQPERFLAAEFVREQILKETRQEVPHSILVVVDEWKDTPELTRIMATIYVEKPGQKGIVLGAGGSMLVRVGTAARQEIEAMLGRKVYLGLFVKVRENWRENPEYLNEIDWRFMRGER